MEPIPAEIENLYDVALNRHGLLATGHNYYIKWLRYYLDFCAKYHHEESSRESLSLFIEKIKTRIKLICKGNRRFILFPFFMN
jgi:hypothetical protein